MQRCVHFLLTGCLFVAVIASSGCAGKKKLAAKSPAVTAANTVKPTEPLIPEVPVTATPLPGKLLNAIAAIVNDEIITLHEVNRDALPIIRETEKKALLDDVALSRVRRTILERLLEKKLADQKIKELHITIGEDDIKQAIDDVKKQNNMTQETLVNALAAQGLTFDLYREQLKDQLEKLKLVSMEVRSKIQVGETEVREYYDSNRVKYSEEETFRARHIFFRINEQSSAADIKKSMQAALAVLAEAKNGADFTELAKKYSEDPAAGTDGGDMGRFKKGEMMPALESTITSMKPGEISELVSTPLGLHIIKLEERNSGKLKPFETVKTDIENELYKKKSEERFAQWLKELRIKSSIEVKEIKGVL